MEVLIVGAGTMGRWFGETVEAQVAFADVESEAAASAAADVGGRTVALDGAETFDAVCLAVPMVHVEATIERHASRAERTILDVSGVMAPALEAMATHAPDLERLSLHPLFAPDAAPGSIPYVSGEAGPVTEAILEDLDAAGNDLVETTAAEHDEAMESVQAAAHAAVLSFALAAERTPEGYGTPIYDGLEALAERMTGGTPRVYADIQRTFDGADAVADAAARIADADDEGFESLYREAASDWADPDAAPTRDAGPDADDGRGAVDGDEEDENEDTDGNEDR